MATEDHPKGEGGVRMRNWKLRNISLSSPEDGYKK